MIRFLRNEEIDRKKWDDCIENSITPLPYAFSWYLDCFSNKWSALVEDDYISVFPIFISRKACIEYIYIPVFLQKLGLFSRVEQGTEKLDEFIHSIPDKFRYTDLSINAKPNSFKGEILERDNYILSLKHDYNEIRKGYNRNCNRSLKIAEEEPFKIIENVKPQESVALMIKGPLGNLSGIKVGDYHNLLRLMSYCIENGKGKVRGVSLREKIIYTIFTIEVCNRITILTISTSEESHVTMAGYFFMDYLIRDWSGANWVLDFAGSSVKSIAEYNMKFGAVKETYYRLINNRLPWPVKFFK